MDLDSYPMLGRWMLGTACLNLQRTEETSFVPEIHSSSCILALEMNNKPLLPSS
jgi:hypothetical protein